MAEEQYSLAKFYKGWDGYQQHLVTAIAPLSSAELALRAAPHQRSIGEIATHLIAARARWFHTFLGEGEENMEVIQGWDQEGEPVRSAAELVEGLEATWQVIQNALTRWAPADLEQSLRKDHKGRLDTHSRQWVIWHVIEHDLHHGGEISFSLGMHGLAAPDL
ncbi:MAG TPA: DinB family protein [Ktedonobacteraceae bacterium]|nr:DinB family protein [Ktedonobacteraceae bacterium]